MKLNAGAAAVVVLTGAVASAARLNGDGARAVVLATCDDGAGVELETALN